MLVSIRNEVRLTPRTETGGPLVGYIARNMVLIVTHASGPGPLAQLKPRSVLIDGAYAQRYCDEMLRKSNGRLDYVGDWHRHRGFSLRTSPDDVDAMKTMAEFEHCPIRHPVSLIYSRYPERVVVYTFRDGILEMTPHCFIDGLPEDVS